MDKCECVIIEQEAELNKSTPSIIKLKLLNASLNH